MRAPLWPASVRPGPGRRTGPAQIQVAEGRSRPARLASFDIAPSPSPRRGAIRMLHNEGPGGGEYQPDAPASRREPSTISRWRFGLVTSRRALAGASSCRAGSVEDLAASLRRACLLPQGEGRCREPSRSFRPSLRNTKSDASGRYRMPFGDLYLGRSGPTAWARPHRGRLQRVLVQRLGRHTETRLEPRRTMGRPPRPVLERRGVRRRILIGAEQRPCNRGSPRTCAL
jgi:hypothetical protein